MKNCLLLLITVLLMVPKMLLAEDVLTCDDLMVGVRANNGDPENVQTFRDDYQKTTVWYYQSIGVKVSFVLIKNKKCYKVIEEIPLSEEAKKKQAEQVRIANIAKAKEIRKAHPKWSIKVCNAIAANEIFIGMTKDQVVESWGKPHKINRTIAKGIVSEQWVMKNSMNSELLYFENEILTGIQQSE